MNIAVDIAVGAAELVRFHYFFIVFYFSAYVAIGVKGIAQNKIIYEKTGVVEFDDLSFIALPLFHTSADHAVNSLITVKQIPMKFSGQ